MQNNTKAALAVGVGYLLGRKHKMRLAAMIAAGMATSGFGGAVGRMLKSGGKQLATAGPLGQLSPEIGRVSDTLKGDLVGAGKAAASAAISNRIEAVTGSLHDRTQSLLQTDEPEEPDQPDQPDQSEGQGDRPAERRREGRGPREDGPGRQRPARPADRSRPDGRRGSAPPERRPASGGRAKGNAGGE